MIWRGLVYGNFALFVVLTCLGELSWGLVNLFGAIVGFLTLRDK